MSAIAGAILGAGLTAVVCLALGKLLLRAVPLRLCREEEHVLAFVAGAACLSLAVFVLAAARAATLDAFMLLAAVAIAAAELRGAHRPLGPRFEPVRGRWRVVFAVLFAFFTYHYLCNALAPEVRPDGAAHHLGLVSRYLSAHGFLKIETSMYAGLPQGAEMLFLFAFAFGKHPAAALVHFAFLAALPLAMLCYGRRFGFPRAAAGAALLVYFSPMAGYNGTAACGDVAAAAVVFCMFYVLQLWDRERAPGLLAVAGLLAGFACAITYSAIPVIPYAAGFVALKTLRKRENPLRPVAVVAALVLLVAGPWAVKNWILADNPLAPFHNRWFPNPYVHTGAEEGYRAQLADMGLAAKLEIPLEATVRGAKLEGLVGPVFLLAPIGLFALRFSQGRQLLAAALFLLAIYPLHIGTRFLLPALPFLALAMMLAFARFEAVAAVIVVAHALSAWPPWVHLYCAQDAARLQRSPVEAALRIQSEEDYLLGRLPRYDAARILDEKTPAEARTFAFTFPPMAYTARTVIAGDEAAFNNNIRDLLLAATKPEWQPVRQLRFRFDARPLRRLRLAQTATGAEDWSVNELRLFSGGRELPRERQWRLRASPNPFEVGMAFDGNPMTRWRSWQGMRGGDFIEVDFGAPERVDAVVLETTPGRPRARLALEGQAEGGAWVRLNDSPETAAVPAPKDPRWMVSRELRWQDIEFVLLAASDPIAADVRAHIDDWGLSLVEERGDLRLYRVE